MRYYLTKCWRGTKLTVATLQTLVSGGVLVQGALMTGGTPFIILGALGLLGSIVLFIDSSKVHSDILKAIRLNEKNLKVFEKENAQFKQENAKLYSSITRLDLLLQQSATEIESLQELKTKYVETLQKFETQLKKEKEQTENLKNQIAKLDALRLRFSAENLSLQTTIKEAQEHAASIESLYLAAIESDKAHRSQAEKLKTIVATMQDLLTTIANEGDQFQHFSTAIDTHLTEMGKQNQSLEHTAQTMQNLLLILGTQKFEELDLNDDGLIDEEEFWLGISGAHSSSTPSASAKKQGKFDFVDKRVTERLELELAAKAMAEGVPTRRDLVEKWLRREVEAEFERWIIDKTKQRFPRRTVEIAMVFWFLPPYVIMEILLCELDLKLQIVSPNKTNWEELDGHTDTGDNIKRIQRIKDLREK